MDDAGYVTHLGRRNELMNAGGFRVSPDEVEQELAKHPAVAEAAVAEIAVRDGVSIIAAFIAAVGRVTVSERRSTITPHLLPDV